MTTDQVVSGLSCAAGRDRGGLLRRSPQLGAVATGALGVHLVAAGPAPHGLLSTPVALLVPVGLLPLADAARLGLIGSRAVSRPTLWAVIVGNLWVAASILAVAAGRWSLTAVGSALVLAQAAAVTFFAGLRSLALRASRPPHAIPSSQVRMRAMGFERKKPDVRDRR
jgi:hypothetical protein